MLNEYGYRTWYKDRFHYWGKMYNYSNDLDQEQKIIDHSLDEWIDLDEKILHHYLKIGGVNKFFENTHRSLKEYDVNNKEIFELDFVTVKISPIDIICSEVDNADAVLDENGNMQVFIKGYIEWQDNIYITMPHHGTSVRFDAFSTENIRVVGNDIEDDYDKIFFGK